MKPTCITALIAALIGRAICPPLAAAPSLNADIIIVGTGISGLAAGLDAGRAGANVTVIDMWSVFGGHAVMSGGLVCLVDTPFQRAQNIVDSPDLAIRDFLTHGQDANPDWVRLYARDSKREVYDWLDALGVGWSQLFPLMPGNSVRRQHWANGRGIGLISPIYRECLRWTNIHFVWNTKVTSLLIEDNQVRGVRGVGLRNGMTNDFHAQSVVLATGGFESNLTLVRQHWPTVLPGLGAGAKVLLGSGMNSLGSGPVSYTHLDVYKRQAICNGPPVPGRPFRLRKSLANLRKFGTPTSLCQCRLKPAFPFPRVHKAIKVRFCPSPPSSRNNWPLRPGLDRVA